MSSPPSSAPALAARQRAHLEAVVTWAERIHEHLGALERAHGRVHFRPGSRGVSMVGLLPERPQRGKSNIRDLARLGRELEIQFARHCRDVEHGRVTPEKRLQSYLVADAFAHDRRMDAIERAAAESRESAALTFVTDEIVVRPLAADGTGKIVCDILALRRIEGGERPVIMELKSSRMKTELLRQTETYAALMLEHQPLFERLYAALLGREVRFAAPPEQWIVWPATRSASRQHHPDLARREITVIEYSETDGGLTSLRSAPCSRDPLP